MDRDVQEAFDKLMHPNLVIDEAVESLKDCIEIVEQSKKKGFSTYLEA